MAFYHTYHKVWVLTKASKLTHEYALAFSSNFVSYHFSLGLFASVTLAFLLFLEHATFILVPDWLVLCVWKAFLPRSHDLPFQVSAHTSPSQRGLPLYFISSIGPY